MKQNAQQKTGKRVRRTLTLRRELHLVSYHDGEKVNRDGSPFYDTAIFRNEREADRFRHRLISEGYEPEF